VISEKTILTTASLPPMERQFCFSDHILAAKRANTLTGTRPPREGQRDLRQADTSELEGEIDQLVASRQLSPEGDNNMG